MDLVVGATGYLGSEICRRLRQRGDEVRALVRKTSDPSKVRALAALGCEIVVGDLQDQASLERACAGIEAVISTASALISRQPHDSFEKTDLEGQINLIVAAERNDVKRFVLVSVSGNLEADMKLNESKRTVEDKLRESGISYTILRPSCFMEVWFSPVLGFDAQNRTARILGSGDEPISFISAGDVAEFAVRAAASETAANQTIELGGPEPVAPNDVVTIFEEELGGSFARTHVPEEALQAQFSSAPDDWQKSFAGLMLFVSGGDSIEMEDTLKRFPMEMTTVRDFARSMKSKS